MWNDTTLLTPADAHQVVDCGGMVGTNVLCIMRAFSLDYFCYMMPCIAEASITCIEHGCEVRSIKSCLVWCSIHLLLVPLVVVPRVACPAYEVTVPRIACPACEVTKF